MIGSRVRPVAGEDEGSGPSPVLWRGLTSQVSSLRGTGPAVATARARASWPVRRRKRLSAGFYAWDPAGPRMPSSFCRVSAQQAPGEGAGLAGQWGLLVARLTGMSLVLRDRGFWDSRDAPGPTGSWR